VFRVIMMVIVVMVSNTLAPSLLGEKACTPRSGDATSTVVGHRGSTEPWLVVVVNHSARANSESVWGHSQ
jgi:hypothetical protein